jgi:hypothetical protein
MTIHEFLNIFEEVDPMLSKIKGDNAMLGLLIISKYIKGRIIQGAGHDILYSVNIEEIIKAGITQEDVKNLADLNWHCEEDEYLACFV